MPGPIDYEMAYRKIEERNAQLEDRLDAMVLKEDYDALVTRMNNRVEELLEANNRLLFEARELRVELHVSQNERRKSDLINRWLQLELIETRRKLDERAGPTVAEK